MIAPPYNFLYKRNVRQRKEVLAKNKLVLQCSPTLKAADAFHEDTESPSEAEGFLEVARDCFC